MRKLILVLAVILFAVPALCGPFIICDPQASATNYRLRLSADGGVTWGPWVEGPPVNQSMRFDLANTPKGNYKGEAQAYGTWEVTDSTSGQVSTVTDWTPSAPFVLKVPNSSEGIKIQK